MVNNTFMAFTTHDPDEAVEAYTKKTGFQPTIILIRPDFVPTKNNPLIVQYEKSAWGVMLLSHLVSPQEVADNPASLFREREKDLSGISLGSAGYSIPTKKAGKPARPQAVCPHCQNRIIDFTKLGFWYGWGLGITPPYWEELRHYVFMRDNYTCQRCHKKFSPIVLQAHHMQHKEDGGADSSRNLETLCVDCHAEHKPIFEDPE